MKKLSTIRTILKRNIPLCIGMLLSVYFSYHLIAGERSLINHKELTEIVSIKEQNLQALKSKKAKLENKVAMLRPDTISADLLDERVRYILGYQHKDEIALLDL